MFVALRDIRFSKGRFALIVSFVTLITLLVTFLTGLTAGLSDQNISSVVNAKADRVVFGTPADGEKMNWNSSKITPEMVSKWEENETVESVEPLAIHRAKVKASKEAPVVLFGLKPSSSVMDEAPSGSGMVRLSLNAAEELGAKSGDSVTIGKQKYVVEQVGAESWYEHSPVIRMTINDAKQYAESVGQAGTFANVLLVDTKDGVEDFSALEADTGTTSKSKLMSFTALSTFKSEIGSLVLMIFMLFAISSLVVGAFFAIWTAQRKPDIAVLKSLGTSTRALVIDFLVQASIVLFLGITFGTLATLVLGAIAGTALPFILAPLTLIGTAGIMMLTGLAGACFGLKSIIKADPLTALNSSH